jgi:nucleoside-diphosphate-sugar epimerase
MDVVTGAFGYTGRFITRRLLESASVVRTLTDHPDRPTPRRAPTRRNPKVADRLRSAKLLIPSESVISCGTKAGFIIEGLYSLATSSAMCRP